MSILVIAEHDNSAVLNATLNTLSAASELSGDIHVLVAGFNCGSVAEQLSKNPSISKVLLVDHSVYEHHLAEGVSKLVCSIAEDYSHILMASTTVGKSTAPRIAALLDVNQISDVIAIEADDVFKRPIYAGNAIATVQSKDAVKVLTVRNTAFDAVDAQSDEYSAEVVELSSETPEAQVTFISESHVESERPELTDAPVVISGGRGMGSGENFDLLYRIADQLGAAVGASRAAVDAGFVTNDMQVGQTGKMVAPELYIAVGISGAIQHLAGMKDSKVIVAINKDEDAPIFQVADYGLVADLFDVLPELETQLSD